MLLVREPVPAYGLTVVGPDGHRSRWSDDESDPADVPSGVAWGTSIPGGADTLTCVLSRDPERSYGDLRPLSEIQVTRDGGRTMRFRLDEVPAVSGDQMAVEPAARGYRALLEDRADVQALFVDRSLSRWGPMSTERRIQHLTTGGGRVPNDVSTTVDPESGLPALNLESGGRWNAAGMYAEGLYDAGEGNTVARIYSEWYDKGYGSGYAARFGVSSSANNDGASWDPSTDLATGATSGTVDATVTVPERYARVDVKIESAITDDVPRAFLHTKVAIFGDHGLTPVGTSPGGFYTGAMLEWLIANRTGLTVGTVDDGTFVHPHAAYHDPTTALSLVENLTRYEPLYDWMVYDDFQLRRRGTYGRRWRARVGPTSLRSAGPSSDRTWNSICVRLDDPEFGTLTVGPPGTPYANTSPYLVDSDPEHPANLAGVTRRALLDIGTSTVAGGIEVGRRYLEEAKRFDYAGSAELVGTVEDEAGVIFPVDEVRAGDEIMFSDARDTGWRRIASTSFSADSATNAITLDSPAPTMEALLARLQAVLVPLN